MFNNKKYKLCEYKNNMEYQKTIFNIRNKVEFNDSIWSVEEENKRINNFEYFDLKFKVIDGNTCNTSAGIIFEDDQWCGDEYVLIPAAIYNGNKFDVSFAGYVATIPENEVSADLPITMTDVPRLNKYNGESGFQMLTADFSIPSICIFYPKLKKSKLIYFSANCAKGINSIRMSENDDKTNCKIEIDLPGVRTNGKYTMTNTNTVNDENGKDFNCGDEVILNYAIATLDCENIHDLYNQNFEYRNTIMKESPLVNHLPFSHALGLIVEKYNLENWRDDYGYYAVGIRRNAFQEFQAGWIGGGLNLYPLIYNPDKLTLNRAYKTCDFIVDYIQVDTGFFYGMFGGGRVKGDQFYLDDGREVFFSSTFKGSATKNGQPLYDGHRPGERLLIRKNADMLYFLIKINEVLKYEKLDNAIIKCCDAFVRMWKKYGQWGQIIDIFKEEIITGITTCGAHAIGALALASKRYNNSTYLECAKEAATFYYELFTNVGVTVGGPGDILHTPDSESSFALLESFVTLYELTNEDTYLEYAKNAGYQAASWVVSYDFDFPKGCEFELLDIKTTGAVYASPQNKHAAPGICTLSGDSLLKLYRFTGDERFIKLAQQIVHNITQYVSTVEKPIFSCGVNFPQRSGHVNERCNLSDWEGQGMVGEIGDGSNWSEVSVMMGCVDFPSVYINEDLIIEFDNVICEKVDGKYQISNPTNYVAEITIMVEKNMNQKLEQFFTKKLPKYVIQPNEEIIIDLD